MTQKQRDIKRRWQVLEYAQECGNVTKTCRHFGISRQCRYDTKRLLADTPTIEPAHA